MSMDHPKGKDDKMPKPMMMTIAVEEIAFGSVFRRVKNMDGVISLAIDAEQDTKSNGKTRAKKPKKGTMADGTSAKCIVLSSLERSGVPMSSSDLMDILEGAGKSRKTFANVTHHAKKDKTIRKTAKGWVITPTGRKVLETECQIGDDNA